MASAQKISALDCPPVFQAGGDGTPFDERQLVEAARTDPEAFATLYRRYLPKIHAFAYRRTRSQHVAEDVCSATFERAFRQLDRFEWRGGGFGAWLFRIAANEIADHWRRNHRPESDRGQTAYQWLYSASTVDDVDRVEDGDEATRLLLAALYTIKDRYQQAISLRYLSELSHEEAADVMGITKPVMAVTLSRALRALKKAMDKMGPREEAS
jgi:RNA polymerase sigma-70 factor (ECF subfamily)